MTSHHQQRAGRAAPHKRRDRAIRSASRQPRINRFALAVVAVGAIIGCQAIRHNAWAADAAGQAPQELTLDQPGDTPPATCQPLAGASANLAPIQLKQTFADNFDSDSLSTSTWETHYPGLDNIVDNRTLRNNSEQQIYVDKDFKGANIDPFKLKDGILSIVVNKTPPKHLDTFKNLRYTSGVITTRHSFEQTTGYFEIRARMPRGKALWPAFWLLRTKGVWPPELDVFEVFHGDKPEQIVMTTHWKEGGTGQHQMSYCTPVVPRADKEFHLYGALWTEQRIVYYIDRKPVGEIATPAGFDHPMYLIANLAVQKGADEKTPLGASFDIDWIAAYAF